MSDVSADERPSKRKRCSYEDLWNERFAELKEFQEEHGHCNVPHHLGGGLGKWVSHQRAKKKNGYLREDREQRLSEIGFDWIRKKAHSWQDRLRQLSLYKEKFGNCSVPEEYDRELSQWVVRQRRQRRQGELEQHRQEMLDELGMEWECSTTTSPTAAPEPSSSFWEDRLRELKDFRGTHGHCRVTRSHGDGQLWRWMGRQREKKRNGTLSMEQQQRLSEVGLEWEPPRLKLWDRRYLELSEYRVANGNCNVPENHPGGLGKWLKQQRDEKRAGMLPADRQKQLEGLGVFTWESRFEELVRYKHEQGHCNVPLEFRGGLGRWVENQKRSLPEKTGGLAKERRDLLRVLGLSLKEERDGRNASESEEQGLIRDRMKDLKEWIGSDPGDLLAQGLSGLLGLQCKEGRGRQDNMNKAKHGDKTGSDCGYMGSGSEDEAKDEEKHNDEKDDDDGNDVSTEMDLDKGHKLKRNSLPEGDESLSHPQGQSALAERELGETKEASGETVRSSPAPLSFDRHDDDPKRTHHALGCAVNINRDDTPCKSESRVVSRHRRHSLDSLTVFKERPPKRRRVLTPERRHTLSSVPAAFSDRVPSVESHLTAHCDYGSPMSACVSRIAPSSIVLMTAGGSSGRYVNEILRTADVLFGPRSGHLDHAGNIRFRRLVAQRGAEYWASHRHAARAEIVREVVFSIFAGNGRFLKVIEPKDREDSGLPEGVDVYAIADDDTILEETRLLLLQSAQARIGFSDDGRNDTQARARFFENWDTARDPHPKNGPTHTDRHALFNGRGSKTIPTSLPQNLQDVLHPGIQREGAIVSALRRQQKQQGGREPDGLETNLHQNRYPHKLGEFLVNPYFLPRIGLSSDVVSGAFGGASAGWLRRSHPGARIQMAPIKSPAQARHLVVSQLR